MTSPCARPRKQVSAFLLAAVFLLANGLLVPFTTQAHATTPPEGICTLAVAYDLNLRDEDSDEFAFFLDDSDEFAFFFDLFANEGVGVVEGRDTLLAVAVFLFTEDEAGNVLTFTENDCDDLRDDLTEQLAPLGVTPSVTFTRGKPDGDATEIAAQAELTLTTDGEERAWSVLGGLSRTVGPGGITLRNRGATAVVPLSPGFGDSAVVAPLVFAPPANTAGEYRVDVEFLVWDKDDIPTEDDASLWVNQHLDMVVGPPLGACLATLMLDADLLDATFENLNDLQAALEVEDDELNREKDALDEGNPRIGEIDERLAEIQNELDGFAALFNQALFDAAVTELQPAMRALFRTRVASPLFSSECATLRNAVFLPAHGTNQPLAGVTGMDVDITLARDGSQARWNDLGTEFNFTDLTTDLADDANVTIQFHVDDAQLLSSLVPSLDTFSHAFQMEIGFVASTTLTPGTYTVSTAYLDIDDPDAPRTVGTTDLNFTVAGAQNLPDVVPVNPERETDEERDDVTQDPDEVEGSFTCSAPVVGVGGSCEVRSAPGQTFRWEASTNPVFASGEVTTDASGVGTFTFDVPASLAGRQILMRIIGLAGSATPIGVASVAIPSGVPAGEGPSPAPLSVWLLIGVGCIGAVWFVRRTQAARTI